MKKIIIIALIAINLFAVSEQKIKIFTEHYPPLNMKVAGELTGLSVEVLDAMFKQMDSKQTIKDIKLTNWSRAYSVAQKVPNSMVFSTTRTKSREDLFKWVGPIFKNRIGVLALKSKKFVINDASDFNKYKIGAVLKDAGEVLLLDLGVNKKSIQHVNGEDAINLSFTKMEKGRIDMFAYDLDVAFTNGKMEGFDMSKYEIIYTLADAELYFAFNKKTNDKIINKWQKSLDTIKEDGIYKKIINKYQ